MVKVVACLFGVCTIVLIFEIYETNCATCQCTCSSTGEASAGGGGGGGVMEPGNGAGDQRYPIAKCGRHLERCMLHNGILWDDDSCCGILVFKCRPDPVELRCVYADSVARQSVKAGNKTLVN